MANQEITRLLQPSGGIEHAALTMAIGIITQRVQSLPKEDQQDLYELLKALIVTEDSEDRESILGAMLEILDQEPGRVNRMALTEDEKVAPALQK
jgi:hypothetical protein